MQSLSRIIASWLFILSKDSAALLVQNPLLDQIVNRLTGLKSGIELNERIGPQQARRQRFLNTAVNLQVPYVDKAANVSRVVVN
jgi:hypothetical protein